MIKTIYGVWRAAISNFLSNRWSELGDLKRVLLSIGHGNRRSATRFSYMHDCNIIRLYALCSCGFHLTRFPSSRPLLYLRNVKPTIPRQCICSRRWILKKGTKPDTTKTYLEVLQNLSLPNLHVLYLTSMSIRWGVFIRNIGGHWFMIEECWNRTDKAHRVQACRRLRGLDVES